MTTNTSARVRLRLLHGKYYIDELYDLVLVRPLRGLGRVCYGIDRYFINGIIWMVTGVPRGIGFALRGWQQGAMQGYALGMVIGLVAVIWWVLIKA